MNIRSFVSVNSRKFIILIKTCLVCTYMLVSRLGNRTHLALYLWTLIFWNFFFFILNSTSLFLSIFFNFRDKDFLPYLRIRHPFSTKNIIFSYLHENILWVLREVLLLSTHNICLTGERWKIIFWFLYYLEICANFKANNHSLLHTMQCILCVFL